MITEKVKEIPESRIPDQIKLHGNPRSSKFKVPDSIVQVNDLNLYYGKKHALKNTYMDIAKNKATAFIGPSGCGKSTLLRCLNRLNDLIDSARVEGKILIDRDDIHDPGLDIAELRKRVGMVFQKSNPFPKSIYENVTYGARLAGENKKSVLDEIVEKSLKAAALWDEVHDRLHENALGMSGGQIRDCASRGR